MPLKSYSDGSPPHVALPTKKGGMPAVADTPTISPTEARAALLVRVETMRFDPDKPPPPEPCAFKLTGVEIAHSGNLVTIAAAVKSGKSSVIAAMLASLMGGEDGDYLGFEGINPDGHIVLHFDTEQSRGDHYQMMIRALRRADTSPPPSWFRSYSLTLFDPNERRTAICALARAASESGKLHSIFIDGVADMVFDVNEVGEACALVTELHQLASETNCVIIMALHHNPGGVKMRGHLGSQVERKSESVLVLCKDGEEVSISCKPARRKEISDANAPRFKWDDALGMHVRCASVALTADDRKRIKLGTLADEVYGDTQHLKWTELQSAIMAARDCAKNTAANNINDMVELGVIRKAGGGLYAKGQP